MEKSNMKFPTDLKGLNENKKNPRAISDDNKKGLTQSLSKFGDISGIVYNIQSGKIVSGHQRRKIILEKCKKSEIIITSEFDKPEQDGTVAIGKIVTDFGDFRIRFVSWSEEKEFLASISANNTNITGRFDHSKYRNLVNDLSEKIKTSEYNDLNIDLVNKSIDIKSMELKPEPKTVWVLIKTDFEKYFEISNDISELSENENVDVEVVISNEY